jgi:putative kinase
MPELQFPETIIVTDQVIDVSTLTDGQKQFYKDLFRELIGLYDAKGKSRLVVALTGPIGSGKSVIAELSREFAKQSDLPFRFETLGIDAFHYNNDYLMSHEAEGRKLKDIKGRYDTYDVPKLVAALQDFRDGKEVSLPEYSRVIHEPVENMSHVAEGNALLLVEGQWVMHDTNGWEAVRPLVDYCYYIDAEKERVRSAVIRRHAVGGRTQEEAARYYDEVDSSNFVLTQASKGKADKVLPAFYSL